MCGIAGIYFRDKAKKVSEDVLKKMCDVIRHRGPDDEGYFLSGNMAIGARRLSIIDLAKGHQPISNENKTAWVALNGEIYNFLELREMLINRGHVFCTDTDTEVIVHLYEEKGLDCVHELSGMFSFVVLDTEKGMLFIARDRLGIKPLYYYYRDGVFIFASEIKAIISVPGFESRINQESLYDFFSLNYVPGPDTMYRGISQLPAGHYLTVSNNGFRIQQYWDIKFNGYTKEGEDAAIEKIQYLIKQSVNRMLKSDVPLGAFLSGGMDSSTIVFFLAKASAVPVKTFSVGFEESSYDESYFAQIAADNFKTEHYKILCRPQDIVESLPKLVWHADNLLADPAMLPLYLVSKLAKDYVSVCLSGDGGDELFLGYPTYTADNYAKTYKSIPYAIRKSIIERLIKLLPVSSEKLSFDYKAKKFIEGMDFSPDKAHYWWRTIFTDSEKDSLFSRDFLDSLQNHDSYRVYSSRYDSCLKEAPALFKYIYADMKVWLGDNNLTRVDAMSMANSLEVRVPFLDHELVEFAASLPPELKMKAGNLKYLLKKAMRRRLPPQIINRKKAGWHIPLAKWFREELKDYVLATLTDSRAIKAGMLNERYIGIILDEHFKARQNNAFKIWGLLVFTHWYDMFFTGRFAGEEYEK